MKSFQCLLLTGLCLLESSIVFGVGSTAASFLRIGVGAKNVAMGETGAASRDADAAYWNPAGLIGVKGKSISVMHAIWLEDVALQNVTYAQKIGNGALGISGTYLSVPEIMKYDNTGLSENSTYKPSDTAFSMSYAREIREMPFGITVKYISSQIDGYTANTVAADVGVLMKPATLAGRKLQIGFALQNIGGKLKFIKDSDPLPFNIKAGAWHALSQSFSAALDLNKAVDNDLIANGGLQYQYSFEDQLFLAARAGFRSNTKGLGGLAGLTSGIGFGYHGIEVDYAFVPYGDVADTHRISLRYNF